MQSSDEIKSKLQELILGLEDEEVLSDLRAIMDAQDERDKRISETLEELEKEVDRLFLLTEEDSIR
jgi:phosphate uptake regulator